MAVYWHKGKSDGRGAQALESELECTPILAETAIGETLSQAPKLRPPVSGKRRLALYAGPLVVWMAAIFGGSSLSAAAVNRVPITLSNYPLALAGAHAFEFMVVAVLAYRLFNAYWKKPLPLLWLAVLAATLAYAASDELHQAFVPGRVPSWIDIGFDSLGAISGLLLAEAVARLAGLLRRVFGSRQIDAHSK